MRGLLRRIQQLEERARPATADGNIHVRFAHVQMLPHTYTGERHRRLVRGTPSESPDNDCLIKELPGPGPDLHFDFEECGRTILVQFVEADGDGHPKGYWPEEIKTGAIEQ